MSNFRIGELDALLPREAKPELKEAKGPGFLDMLGKAMGEVEALQAEGDAQAKKLAEGGGNLHETALAMEKADVSMRVMVKVRAKLLEAYNEVMRMSV